jgi:hypothetical protein
VRAASALLAVTPPRRSAVTLADQVQMLAALAHARREMARGVALEIVGAEGHVRFQVRAATPAARAQLDMVLSGYYPQGTLTPLDQAADPAVIRPGEEAAACELRLSRCSALPLRTILDDERSGQILRLIGVLRRLPPGTRALCQLILWPGPPTWHCQLDNWLQQERERAHMRPAENAGLPPAILASTGLLALAGITGYRFYHTHDLVHLAGLAGAVGAVAALALARMTVFAPEPPPDPRLVERKLAAPAFTARLRLFVAGGTAGERARGRDALIAAYCAYQDPRGNGFVARTCSPRHVVRITMAGGPRFWRRPWPLLNAEEVASLWRLPADTVDVPGLARHGPLTLLPASPALMSGIPVGTATVGTHTEAVFLPRAAYRANIAVVGATGTGKSTFLQHLARDAMGSDGVQVVVLDPESELVAAMAGALPEEERRRAVVVRFGHPERAVGLNLLDAHTGRNHAQITSSLIEAWKRFYEDAWGPRLEDLIRASCTTILKANRTRPRERQLTLLDIKPLLRSTSFRTQVVAEADDIRLAAYWRDDYMGMPRTDRLNAIKPVETRINRFLDNDAAHAILGQPASTLDPGAILASGAPLLIDAAARVIGTETAALLDAVLINLINDLVCERPDAARARQVLIVVDEFQHAPGLWEEYLTRIRKHRGSYVLVSQGLTMVNAVRADLHKVLIGNTGTQVVFRTLDPDEAAYLAGALEHTVTPEDLQTLKLRQCYIKTSDDAGPLPVVSATLPPPPPSSPGTAGLIAEACSCRYGRPIAAVMAARKRWMTELYHAGDLAQAPARPPATNAAPPAPASVPPGSQPTHGVPVTRASPMDSAPPLARGNAALTTGAPATSAPASGASRPARTATPVVRVEGARADRLPLPDRETPPAADIPPQRRSRRKRAHLGTGPSGRGAPPAASQPGGRDQLQAGSSPSGPAHDALPSRRLPSST